jgi:uncharacterized protein YbaR (Trm112 family)
MALNRDLIDILACPKCKGPLTLRPDESAFECAACKLAYLVADDIPNFLIDEAQPLCAWCGAPRGNARKFFASGAGAIEARP